MKKDNDNVIELKKHMTASKEKEDTNMFDYEKEREEFARELRNGEFNFITNMNNEEDYMEKKQERDTSALNDFLKSDLFDRVKGMK